MELKYLDYDFIQEITVGSNCTFMELKFLLPLCCRNVRAF